jgi:hypothetical protein
MQGCNPPEPVPSFISVQGASLSVLSDEGSASSNISDIWINIDGNKQGIYELPATFPLIAEGNHTVTLKAGIKVNGIAASRIVYPFYDVIEFDTTFVAEQSYVLNPVFKYKADADFGYLEDFQNNGFTLDTTYHSDTVLYQVADTLNPGNKYGVFYLDPLRRQFQCVTNQTFTLPRNGMPVFLELDYQNTQEMVIGMIINKAQQTIELSVIVLNAHPNSMNKIYIDLTDVVVDNADAVNFNIFIGAVLNSGSLGATFKIDNMKLVYF